MPSPYINSGANTSGQKPTKAGPLPLSGAFSLGVLPQKSSPGLLTGNTVAGKVPTQQGTPSVAQVKTGLLNTPFNASSATQPVTTVKPKSVTDGLTGPAKTLPQQFQAKTTGTPASTNAVLASNSAPTITPPQSTNANNGVYKDSNNNVFKSDGTPINQQTFQQMGLNIDHINLGSPTSSPSGSSTPTATPPPNPPGPTPQDTSYGGLISQLANRGQSDSPEVQQARQALTASQLAESKTLGFNSKPADGGGVSMDTGMGNDALQRALYGNEQNALSSQLSSAVTTQGQQIEATQGAAGLTAPTAFGLSMNPVTGQPINMSAMQVPLQTALNLYKSGTPLSDPSYAQALGPIGSAGWMAFYNALQNGGTNPVNPAIQSAQTNTNITQGSDYQKQSTDLSTQLSQLRVAGNLTSSFIQQTGLNQQGSPFFNQQQNTTIGQLINPSNVASYNDMINQITSSAAQVLGSSGMTPTQITSMIGDINPKGMTFPQLNAWLQNVDAIGQKRLGVLQSQSSSSYTSGGGAFQGGAATNNPTVVGPDTGYTNPNNKNTILSSLGQKVLASPAGQDIIGGISNFAGSVGAIGSAILGFLHIGG